MKKVLEYDGVMISVNMHHTLFRLDQKNTSSVRQATTRAGQRIPFLTDAHQRDRFIPYQNSRK